MCNGDDIEVPILDQHTIGEECIVEKKWSREGDGGRIRILDV